MTKPRTTIDDFLKALTAQLDMHLTENGCMNTGDVVTVGYFELRNLLEYIDAQHNNLIVLECLTNTVVHEASKLGQKPFIGWREELQVTRTTPGFVVR